jgi:hypothetical protein
LKMDYTSQPKFTKKSYIGLPEKVRKPKFL